MGEGVKCKGMKIQRRRGSRKILHRFFHKVGILIILRIFSPGTHFLM